MPFMTELFQFQFHQYVALEHAMIEYKVHEVMGIPDKVCVSGAL